METSRGTIATHNSPQSSSSSTSEIPGTPSVYKYGLPPVAVYSNSQSKLSSSPPYIISNEVRLNYNINSVSTSMNSSPSANIWVEGSITAPGEGGTQVKFNGNGTKPSEPSSSVKVPISQESHQYKRNIPSVVPKCRKNAVTLPVPSPPLVSTISTGNTVGNTHGNQCIGFENGISIDLSVKVDSESDNASAVPLRSRIVETGEGTQGSSTAAPRIQRTLISTEAQTEDLTSLAPPPRTRNREHRKRERRERRRHRQPHHNHHHLRYRSNQNPSSATSREGSAQSQPMETDSVPSVIEASTSNRAEQNHGDTCTTPGSIDVISSPPPPYSTLPMPSSFEPRTRRPIVTPSVTQSISPQLPTPITTFTSTPPQPSIHQIPYCAAALAAMTQPLQNCLSSTSQPVRYQLSPPLPARASRRSLSLRAFRGIPYSSEEEPKSCCGMSTSQAVSIRWFIIVIAGIGICCTVAGTALGAARSAGSQHLTLSLLMIGVGVVLLTVSAIAWRLTANETGTSSCRAMLGFGRNGSSRGDGGSEPNRVFVPRLPPSYGRPHHPYAAMLYPDFQYRPPPPSYQASMQEYRLRLLLLERSNPNSAHVTGNPTGLNLSQPPPAYRPYNPTIWSGNLNPRGEYECSRPPSYQSPSSHAGSHDDVPSRSRDRHPLPVHLRNTIDPSPIHVRNPSILSFLSQQSIGDSISIVSGSGVNENVSSSTHHDTNGSQVVTVMEVNVDMGQLGLDFDTHGHDAHRKSDTKACPEDESSVEKQKDGNLVRIVQTTDSSQVIGRDSVIVTVSGSQNHSNQAQLLWDHLSTLHQTATNQNQLLHYHLNPPDNNEVQILAHL